ncbi:hypothetical protein [Anaerotignum sp.]
MAKEKKGLFGRLMEFWREKISEDEMDSIGFWHEKADMENHFSEMGAVAVLSQEETKKSFWQETAGKVSEKKKEMLLPETVEEETEHLEEAEKAEKKKGSEVFATEVFWGEKQEGTEKTGLEKAFLWEMPEKEREKRSIVPVMADVVEKKEPLAEEMREISERTERKKEEQQAQPEMDIEKLMRQMTKKLWEERESCGRRLR